MWLDLSSSDRIEPLRSCSDRLTILHKPSHKWIVRGQVAFMVVCLDDVCSVWRWMPVASVQQATQTTMTFASACTRLTHPSMILCECKKIILHSYDIFGAAIQPTCRLLQHLPELAHACYDPSSTRGFIFEPHPYSYCIQAVRTFNKYNRTCMYMHIRYIYLSYVHVQYPCITRNYI